MTKKISIALTILFAISFAAQAQTVGSANIMGYSKITIPSNSYVLGSFDFTSGPTNYFNAVFGTSNLISNSRLSRCEIVYLWDASSQSYSQYAQYNGQTYSTADWKGTPANPAVTGGFFIQAYDSTNRNIMVSGDVRTTSSQAVNIVGGDGYTMISYPYSSDIAISNLNITGATAGSRISSADLIYKWVDSAYVQYALYSGDGKWYNVNDWKVTPTTDNINTSEGFWYFAQNPVTWSASNLYYEALNN